MDIIDFHSHHLPLPLRSTMAKRSEGAKAELWRGIDRKLSDLPALTADIESGDITARVVNVPLALTADATGLVPHDMYRLANDSLAGIARDQARGVIGLATVDAFDGSRAASEARRAIIELGLRGLFVDCARGDSLLDAAEARPTLRAAAEMGVPVFVHPIDPQPLSRQLAPHGRIAGLLARGTINAASLIAMVEGGVFEELPDLQVVITALGLSAVLLHRTYNWASQVDRDSRFLRRNVHVDTTGLDPLTIRTAVAAVGVDKVILGSDWPILNDAPIRDRVQRCLSEAGLDDTAQVAVAAGNARRLLGLAPRAA